MCSEVNPLKEQIDMPKPSNTKRGGEGKPRRFDRGVLLKHLKNLDDFIRTYVTVTPLRKVGYVWGGMPADGIDKPDILYVAIDGADYEVRADAVEPIDFGSEVKTELPFEDTSGGDVQEAAAS